VIATIIDQDAIRRLVRRQLQGADELLFPVTGDFAEGEPDRLRQVA